MRAVVGLAVAYFLIVFRSARRTWTELHERQGYYTQPVDEVRHEDMPPMGGLSAPVVARCPDDGACHHGCAEHYKGACWRVFNAAPLTGSGWESWPASVKRRHLRILTTSPGSGPAALAMKTEQLHALDLEATALRLLADWDTRVSLAYGSDGSDWPAMEDLREALAALAERREAEAGTAP